MSKIDTCNLVPGMQLGGYRIECELGRGAMAVVYRAIQLNLDRPVALKVLPSESARDEEFVNRFFNEARAAAALSHPNIVQAYDAGVAADDIYYFAMEYIEGETLLDRINRDGPLPLREGVEIALRIAEALDYGWNRQRLTHGDIKPENIMLNHSGDCKLADFGLAKVQGQENDEDGVMLTPLYAAPELIRGQRQRHDCRPDIYSFGASLYHILAGMPPFPGDDPQTVMRRHLDEEAVALHKRNPTIPLKLSEYVALLLSKNPELRPQSWAEISKRLHSLSRLSPTRVLSAQRQGPAAVGKKPRRQQTNVLLWSFVALFALMLIGLIGYALASRQTPARPRSRFTPTAQTPRETARAEWVALKGQLANLSDRQLCRRLLEDFGRRHAGNVPSEFQRYCKTYGATDTSGQGRADELSARKPAARGDLDQQLKTIFALAQTGQVQHFQELDNRLQLALRHPGLTSSERQRLEQLQASIQGLRAFEQTAADQPLTALDNAQRDAQFEQLLFEFTKLSFGMLPGTQSYAGIEASARQWLDAYPPDTEQRQVLEFLLTVIRAGGTELPQHLAARQQVLAGTVVAANPVATVKEVSAVQGVQFTEPTQYGARAYWKQWQELDAAVLAQLVNLAFADPELGTAGRRPIAAYLFLTRNLRMLGQFLSNLPDQQEREQWRRLITAVAAAERTGKAAETWATAQELFGAKRFAAAARLLDQLRQSNTELVAQNQAAIDTMLATCEHHSPAAQAARLLEAADVKMFDDIAAAVALSSTSISRFGNTGFPQLAQARNLPRQAFAKAADKIALTQPGFLNKPLTLLSLVPQLNQDLSSPLLAVARLAKDQEEPRLPAAMREQMLAVVFLTLGDWQLARDTLAAQARKEEKEQFPISHVALCYARARVGQRFAKNNSYVDKAVIALHEAARHLEADSAAGTLARALLAELALHTGMSRDEVGIAAMARQWPQRQVQGGGDREQYLAMLAWLLHAGYMGDAMTLLTVPPEQLRLRGFTNEDVTFLAALTGYINGRGAPPSKWETDQGRFRDWLQRLLVTALLRRDSGGDLLQEYAAANYRNIFGGSDVAASTWFDLVVVDVAALLRNRQLAAASNTVDNALRLNKPSLNCYYPRLRLLAAGLALLQNQTALADEHLKTIEYSSVASAAELAAVQIPHQENAGNIFFPAFSYDKDGSYWGAWLLWTQALGNAKPGDYNHFAGIMEKIAAESPPRLLLKALQRYANTELGKR